MSTNVARNTHFIGLLINGDKKQSLGLLKLINDGQAKAIKEIAFNIENYVNLYPVLGSVLNKYKVTLKSLRKSKLTRSYIRRNNKTILSLLNKIHPILRELIK